jgi:hypothetical protein
MPLTTAPRMIDDLIDPPSSVLITLRSARTPPAPALDGPRPRYSRKAVRLALARGAGSLDETPDGRRRFLRALGELEAYLLDLDARVEKARAEVLAARVEARPLSVAVAASLPVLAPPRRAPAPPRVRLPAGLMECGLVISFGVLLTDRGDAVLAAAHEPTLWAFLVAGGLLYAAWDLLVRVMVLLAARVTPLPRVWRVVVPVSFSVLVIGHALALLAGFDVLVGAARASLP